MRNIFYVILFYSFLFSISFERYNSDFYNVNHLSYYKTSSTLESNASLLGNAGSLLIPGFGQFSRGYYKKAIIFLCIESLAIGGYYYYNQKSILSDNLTKEFGDDHWSFFKWIDEYYDFKDHEYSYIFEKENGSYVELWEDSHRIEFKYGNEYKTTGHSFEQFYEQELCPGDICLEENFESIEVIKDHNYYENIGKYDHFFAGWDDSENIYEFEKDSGEKLAMSSNKQQYRNYWGDVEEFNRMADYALYTIYINHILNIVDLLVFSTINKNSKFNYKIGAIYNPNNILGVGGVTFSVLW